MYAITLFATICLAGADPAASPGACVHEHVTDSILSPGLTMSACRGVAGQMSALQYVQSHPLYASDRWSLAGWDCRDGPRMWERGI